MWVGSERSTLCASANEELGSLADNTRLTGYEPKVFDYHILETFAQVIGKAVTDLLERRDRRPTEADDVERFLTPCRDHGVPWKHCPTKLTGKKTTITRGSRLTLTCKPLMLLHTIGDMR